jgi:hypothetical protein
LIFRSRDPDVLERALIEWSGEEASWVDVWSPSASASNGGFASDGGWRDVIVFDETRQKLICVGYSYICEWDEDARSWRVLLWTGVILPFGAAYDRARGVVVVIGGAGVVEWNSRTGSLTRYSQTATDLALFRVDGPVMSALVGYDPRLKKVVAWSRDDGWSWDPTTGQWLALGVYQRGGPKRGGGVTGMTYDSVAQRWVFFGERSSAAASATYLPETWEWDSQSNSWSYLTLPRQPRPSPRGGHAMVFDEARGRVVLFGGWEGEGRWRRFTDTWEWDGGVGVAAQVG